MNFQMNGLDKFVDYPKVEKRAEWGRQIEFLLSCVGYSVGLVNIWRFPYLCLQNGGGAFLIPYLLYLVVCGIPLYLMEAAVGQSTGLSTIQIFNMVPFFQGLGWCMIFASGIVSIYCNILVAYTLYFLGWSFSWTLPWSHCGNGWNSDRCFTYGTNNNLTSLTSNFSMDNTNEGLIAFNGSSRRTSAEEFWLLNVLEISEGISQLGGLQWKLLLALTAAWIITFACMFKGIHSAGKVVYVTATAPYIFLTIIFIRGCTLPGAWDGIKFYILPDWNRLLSVNVWIAAATQIFYSLGPAWGGLITFGSYNRFNHNVLRDSIIIPIICCGTSIYGGFAVFSVIGHLMYVTGQNDTTQIALQGPGLAFVAYPQALTQLPGAAIWSVLFFLMLLTVGVDSQFSTLETVTTGLVDRFPIVMGKHKLLFTFLICFIEYCIGFLLVTRAGFYYFELLDTYSTAFSVVVIGFFETIVIGHLYGSQQLLDDITNMTGPMCKAMRIWWTLTWRLITPVMTLVLIVTTCVYNVTSADEKLAKFPAWAIAVGWTIAFMSFVQFPILAVYSLYQHGFNWRKLFLASDEWQRAIERRMEMCSLDGEKDTKI